MSIHRYDYSGFDSNSVTDSDFDVPGGNSTHCKLFQDKSSLSPFGGAISAATPNAMPSPWLTARRLEMINAPARLRRLNAALEKDGLLWRAASQPAFFGKSIAAHASKLLRRMPIPTWASARRRVSNVAALNVSTLPDDFDSRTMWPHCKGPTIIANQGDCGSCFAWAAAESFQDRLCIVAKTDVTMSKMWILGCERRLFFSQKSSSVPTANADGLGR